MYIYINDDNTVCGVLAEANPHLQNEPDITEVESLLDRDINQLEDHDQDYSELLYEADVGFYKQRESVNISRTSLIDLTKSVPLSSILGQEDLATKIIPLDVYTRVVEVHTAGTIVGSGEQADMVLEVSSDTPLYEVLVALNNFSPFEDLSASEEDLILTTEGASMLGFYKEGFDGDYTYIKHNTDFASSLQDEIDNYLSL